MNQRHALFLFISFLLFGCASISEKPDPVLGTWDYEIHELPRGEPIGEMIITKEDGVYAVVLKTAQGETSLENLVIEGDTLVDALYPYRNFQVKLTGTFTENTYEGTMSANQYEFRMTATKRE